MMPMCWKCKSAITKLEPVFQSPWLVGCEECPEIKRYEDAKLMCPLLKETVNEKGRKQD